MKRSAVISALAAVAVALGLASCAKNAQVSTTTDSTTTTTMTPAQKIERGQYLSTIGGCNDCHTPGTFYGAPDMSRQLSGSELGWTGPWGTSYAANITPDSATGTGRYSEDDLVNAFRKGVKPGGAPILPPMPWPNYAHLSDEDAYALAAYLKSVPPVVHAVPADLPPGKRASAALVFPPPPAWDAPRTAPPGMSVPEPAPGVSRPTPGGTKVTTPAKPDTI
jgi:mono/diheme cytochrome c family protein